MNVTKRNGAREAFDENKILAGVVRCCDGIDHVDTRQVFYNAKIKLYDSVPTTEIDKALIKSARALIEEEPNYTFVAARLLLTTVYKEVFGENTDNDLFELQYRKAFIANIKTLIEEGIASKELKKFNLKRLSEHLVINRDEKFEYLGLQTIYDRYLYHIKGRKVETPQAFWMRVAMGLAIREKPEERDEWAIKFYDVLSTFSIMSSTPTLFNSGGVNNQLSSCFLSTFEDSIDGIFDGLHQESLKSKYAGGLGMDLTAFRPQNCYIKGTNGYTQGAVYFWKLYNDMLVAVNQGGKRKGAGCAYVETWHGDIQDFLELRKNTGDERKRTHDMNTANWIPDLFMKQVESNGMWYLFSPAECPELHETFGDEFEKQYWGYVEKGKAGKLEFFKEIEAKELWKKMLRMVYETGHPWITFKDPSNIRYSNQHAGVVHSSNLCTEILLHTKPTTFKEDGTRKVKEYGETAVCNLASINLARFVNESGIDWGLMENCIRIAMRMLDNVVDINFYPTEEARKSNTTHRPVGLGSMGWHDVYHALNTVIDSNDAAKLASSIYEFISYNAIRASCDLAKERGKYSSYDGSLWSKGVLPVDTYIKMHKIRTGEELALKDLETLEDWDVLREDIKKYGMRNSNTMAIAPTASISSITGTCQSIEPYFSNIFVYSTLSGDFTMVNKWFVEEMRKYSLWNDSMLTYLKNNNGDIQNYPFKVSGELTEDKIKFIKAKYKTAFQIDQFKLIDNAAKRQIWIDQGQSLNLYNDKTSLKFLNDIYMYAWKSCLKTTYYLRGKGASEVEKSTVAKTVQEQPEIDTHEEEPVKMCIIGDPNCMSCQ